MWWKLVVNPPRQRRRASAVPEWRILRVGRRRLDRSQTAGQKSYSPTQLTAGGAPEDLFHGRCPRKKCSCKARTHAAIGRVPEKAGEYGGDKLWRLRLAFSRATRSHAALVQLRHALPAPGVTLCESLLFFSVLCLIMPACRRYALAGWWSSYWRRSRALLLTGTRLLIQAGSVSVCILEERMCAAGCELALAPSGMANRCGACRSADWTGKREQRGQIPNSQASPHHRAKVMAPTLRAGRHRHVHSTSRSGQRSSFQIFPSSNWHRRPAREILRLGPLGSAAAMQLS